MKLVSAQEIDVTVTVSPRQCHFSGEMEEIVRLAETLVARKQQLLGLLKENQPGPRRRQEIERHLKELDATFNFLDEEEPRRN